MGGHFGSRKRTPWAERDLENVHRALRVKVLHVLSTGERMSPAQIRDKANFGPISPVSFINMMSREGLIVEPEPWSCIGFGGGWKITDAGRAYLSQQKRKEI